jgi:hypothetical protein
MKKDKALAVAGSYLRAAFASVLTVYLSGVTDNKALATAFIASIAAPILKWLDPKETAFGKGSK